uniref:Uncharacterized protein n=1 Tax=Chromera velia CCMP2878 TaxID=1169474 RepID=A0A0G4HKG8_9ALVE|eukprot:Cvel_7205.t1-p1 / transcript=Cvel_7205.t1 / gene=Cvel_7205 / organism=Chromera_velia_CCMP2878 / gene_product=hypothetical protein / transcript_product=hypothetical protein / location=Cvel_scaffold371:23204-24248(+) / protein_length=132 / sequence_SO=supercontig / SO=protein_coding / is_pseudo=false
MEINGVVEHEPTHRVKPVVQSLNSDCVFTVCAKPNDNILAKMAVWKSDKGTRVKIPDKPGSCEEAGGGYQLAEMRLKDAVPSGASPQYFSKACKAVLEGVLEKSKVVKEETGIESLFTNRHVYSEFATIDKL